MVRRLVLAVLLFGGIAVAPLHAQTSYLKTREVHLPFRQPAAVGGQSLRPLLFVSPDRGQSWRLAAAAVPERDRFALAIEQEGEYWFSVKSIDAAGQMSPPGPHVPAARVILDFTPPILDWDVWAESPTEAACTFEIRDRALDAASLRLELLPPGGRDRWEPFPIDPRLISGDEQRVRGFASTTLRPGPGRWVVRLSVRDRAGNVTEAVRELQLGPAAAVAPPGPWLRDLSGTVPPAAAGPLPQFAGPSAGQRPAVRPGPFAPGEIRPSGVVPTAAEEAARSLLPGEYSLKTQVPTPRPATVPEDVRPRVAETSPLPPPAGPALVGVPVAPPVEVPPAPRPLPAVSDRFAPRPLPEYGTPRPLPEYGTPRPLPEYGAAVPLPPEPAPFSPPGNPEPERFRLARQPGVPADAVPPGKPVELLPPLQERNLEYEILQRAARNATAAKDWPEAVKRFEALLNAFPEDLKSRAEFAGVLIQAGAIERAIEQYRHVVEAAPDDVTTIGSLIDALVSVRRFDEAKEFLAGEERAGRMNAEAAAKYALVLGYAEEYDLAEKIFDKYLTKVNLSEPKVQEMLAPVLIQLRRPEEARPLLEEIRKRKPDDLAAAANLVLVNLQLGRLGRAQELVTELAPLEPDNLDYRLQFADRLEQPEARDLVVALCRQVLDRAPANRQARTIMANAYLRTFEPHTALNVLKERPPEEFDRDYELVLGTAYTVSGEYGDALIRLRELLLKYPDDVRIRLSLGDLFMASEEYEKARAQHHRAEQLAPKARLPKLRLARNFAVQRFFERSNELLRQLILERPHDSEPFELLCENLAEQGQYPEIERLIHARRQKGFRNREEALAMHLALGRAFLLVRMPLEAHYEFEQAGQLVEVDRPEGAYGKYASLKMLQNPMLAREELFAELEKTSLQAYYRYRIARLAIRDCDFHLGLELLSTVVQFDPEHDLAACWEALCRHRLDPSGPNAIGAYESILQRSPANIIARLNLARTYSYQHTSDFAVANYDLLLRHLPTSLVAAREKARELLNWKGWDCACPAYDEALRIAKQGDPLTGPPIRPGEVPTPSQQAEFSLGEEDYRITATEKAAKSQRGWRPLQAAPTFRALTEMEPSNGDGFFELSQVMTGLEATQDAICAYDELLNLDPCNREAAIGRERAYLEMRPKSYTSFDYFEQFGRDGLASVRRTRVTEDVRLPYGDEDEYWLMGYSRVFYDPVGNDLLTGNHFRGGLWGKFDPTWRYWGMLQVEAYPDRIKTRATYDAGVEYRGCEGLTLRGATFLDNVVENGEAMDQDIYRIGMRLSADYWIRRNWWMQTGLRFSHYSDDNDAWDFFVHNRFGVTLPPRQLQVLLDYDFLGYADQTQFNADPTDLNGIVHPYFAPPDYSTLTITGEWKHWLTDDLFTGANQHWYSLQYGLRFDSESEVFNLFKFIYNRDLCNWLTFRAETSLLRSGVYQNTGANAMFVVRLPLQCGPPHCGPWIKFPQSFRLPRELSPEARGDCLPGMPCRTW